MIKQMMKIANARNKEDFLKMFPTEASFLRKHGGELFHMMYGGTFADGGAPQEMMQQAPPMEQQGPPQEQGGGGEQAMEQVVQFIIQAIQQQVPQEQIIAQLVQMTGMPEEQAVQLLQMVVEKMSGAGGQQAPPEQMAQGPEQQMMEQGPPQPGMKLGGKAPCYKCGGKYKKGGSYSGTYSAGVYYRGGGAYMPDYTQYAYGGDYPMYAGGGEPCPDPNMIESDEGLCVCKPGFEVDQMTGGCIPIGSPTFEDQNYSNNNSSSMSPFNNNPMLFGNRPRGSFNAGFGLSGNRYNLDYGLNMNSGFNPYTRHNLSLNLPGAFRTGANKGDLDLRGTYVPGSFWSGDVAAGIPLSGKKGRGDLLRFTGGLNQTLPNKQQSENPDENFMMVNQNTKSPINYNAGLEYTGKMFGERGPNVRVRASYDKQKYGGTPEYKKGGEYEMSQEEIQDLINKGYKIQYV